MVAEDPTAVAAARSRLLLWRRVQQQFLAEQMHLPSVYTKCFDQRKLIFVHIPKCAGTSVSSVVCGQSPWHYSAVDLLNINFNKFFDYFSFASIRDPFTRLYSIYRYAIKDVTKFRFSPLKTMSKMDFDEFVDTLDEEIVMAFPFLRPQISYICTPGGELLVDKLVRMENIREDLQPILDRFDIQIEVFPHLNATETQEPVYDLYSQDMRAKVSWLYREDFGFGGY